MQRQPGPSPALSSAQQRQGRFAKEHFMTLALLGSLDQLPKIEPFELHGPDTVSQGRITLTPSSPHLPPTLLWYDHTAQTGPEPRAALAPGSAFPSPGASMPLSIAPHLAQPPHPGCPTKGRGSHVLIANPGRATEWCGLQVADVLRLFIPHVSICSCMHSGSHMFPYAVVCIVTHVSICSCMPSGSHMLRLHLLLLITEKDMSKVLVTSASVQAGREALLGMGEPAPSVRNHQGGQLGPASSLNEKKELGGGGAHL